MDAGAVTGIAEAASPSILVDGSRLMTAHPLLMHRRSTYQGASELVSFTWSAKDSKPLRERRIHRSAVYRHHWRHAATHSSERGLLSDRAEHWADTKPDDIAIIYEDRQWTWSQWRDRIHQVSGAPVAGPDLGAVARGVGV